MCHQAKWLHAYTDLNVHEAPGPVFVDLDETPVGSFVLIGNHWQEQEEVSKTSGSFVLRCMDQTTQCNKDSYNAKPLLVSIRDKADLLVLGIIHQFLFVKEFGAIYHLQVLI